MERAGIDHSDEDVEVLDLTTPSPAVARSRIGLGTAVAPVSASTRTVESPDQPLATSRRANSGNRHRKGTSINISDNDNHDSVGNECGSDDDGPCVIKPLRERLHARKVAAAVAAAATAAELPSSSCTGDGSTSRRDGRGVSPDFSSHLSLVEHTSSSHEVSGAAAGTHRPRSGKAKANSGKGCVGEEGEDWREKEEEDDGNDDDFLACTQESDAAVVLVDLLSDSGGEDAGTDKLDFDALALASQTSAVSESSQHQRKQRRRRQRGDSMREEEGAGSTSIYPTPADLESDIGNGSDDVVSMGDRDFRCSGEGVIEDSDDRAAAVSPKSVRARSSGHDIDGNESSDDEFSMDTVGGGPDQGTTNSIQRECIVEGDISGGSNSCSGSGKSSGVVSGATALSKEEKALARREATANKKRQRQEEVAAKKEQRARERQEISEQKAKDKETEKAAKAAKKEMEQQARGKFSHLEIACVMERRFFESPRSAIARAGAAAQPNGTEEFMVTVGDCGTPGAVWWTRREHVDGGAAAIGPGVITLDMLAVVVHPEVFLSKLRQAGAGGESAGAGADVGNVFPALGDFIKSIRNSAPGFSRLIFVLEGVEDELHRRWNTQRGPAASCTMDRFEDAQSWMLIHKDVETRLTKDGKETGQYLWDLTRALSAMPYKDDVTELHCVNRFKTKAAGSEALPKEEQDLADTWVRMLQHIPGIGETKALEIATHFPLPRDLVRSFTDPSVPEAERAVLLADKMGSHRNEEKRARRVFDLFTHEDGNFVLS